MIHIVVIKDIDYNNPLFGRIPFGKTFVDNTPEAIIDTIKEMEKVVITWTSTTFLDLSLVERLYNEKGEILFIANLPEYMEFEVWEPEFLVETLKKHSKVTKPLRSVLSPIELDESVYFTDVLEKDIRIYRWEFSPLSYKGRKLSERFVSLIDLSKNVAEQLELLIRKFPEYLVEIPSFYYIEISSENVETEYLPKWKFGIEDMSSREFESIVERILNYSKTTGIMVGVHNEPLLNKEFDKITKVISDYVGNEVSFIINTSLPYLPNCLLELIEKTKEIRGFKGYPYLSVFVDLPSNTKDAYENLKKLKFDEVMSSLNKLLEVDTSRVFIKFVRTIFNDQILPYFYDKFKKYNVIIQRPQIPNLSPVDTVLPTRIPCYKLQTSLVVLGGGEALPCINDIRAENVLGNVLSDHLEEICTKKTKLVKEHLDGKFLGMCENCVVWDQFDL